MTLIRFRPFPQTLDPSRDLTDIQTQMNRLFDNLTERVWTPPVDMYETKNEVVVAVELPGLNENEIRLSITGDLLTITARSAGSGSSSGPSPSRFPSRPARSRRPTGTAC